MEGLHPAEHGVLQEGLTSPYLDFDRASWAGLRASTGADPDDPALAALVGELSVNSADFASMWARHDVHAKTTGMTRYRHPLVGPLELDYQTFAVNGAGEQTLHVFSAEPGSPSADALLLLARTAAPEPSQPDG